MTLEEEFAHLLVEVGAGTYKADGSAGGTIYLATLPPAPDDAIAVGRYGGGESDSKLAYDEPRIQIRLRGGKADVRTVATLAQLVYDRLHGLSNRPLAGGTWLMLAVGINGGPAYIGRDDNARHAYVVNLRCEVQRPTPNRV